MSGEPKRFKPILRYRWQRIVTAIILLPLAYLLASRAIDTGSWWQYSGAIISIIVSINLFISIFRRPSHNA